MPAPHTGPTLGAITFGASTFGASTFGASTFGASTIGAIALGAALTLAPHGAQANSADTLAARLLTGLAERRSDIVSAVNALSATEAETGALMFYDPQADLAGAAGDGRYQAGDRAWVEAALAVYDLHRQLGGKQPDRRQIFRRDKNGYFIGEEGGAGAWHDSTEAALAFYFDLLGRVAGPRPKAISEATRQSVTGGITALIDAIEARVAKAPSLIALRPGEAETLTLTKRGFAVGSPGLRVRTESAVTGIVATVSTGASASGIEAVYGYDDDRRFRASETIEVTVDRTTGGRNLAEAEERPATVAPPVPLTSQGFGSIEVPGDVGVFTVDVTESGQYSITSGGPSDMKAVLLDGEGTAVASDDDGGSGYNFRIEGTLEAGSYRLEVRHCCGGTGPYELRLDPAE